MAAGAGNLALYTAHSAGDGETVLLVHGFGSCGSATWEKTGWTAALHEAGYDVLVPDLRGHGASPKPREARDYSADVLADDLRLVLDSYGAETAHVIAHSMGCVVARALALAHPERVLSLALCGAGLADPLSGRDFEADKRFLLDGTPLPPGTSSSVLAAARGSAKTDAQAMLACMQGMAGHGVTGIPRVPVLVVAGELDDVVRDTPAFAASIGAPLYTVPGCGHGDMLRDDDLHHEALRFLASHVAHVAARS